MTAAHEDHAFPFVEMNAEGQPTAIETGMTLRQYAAIKLRVPNSDTDWLDEMIREARRDELAARARKNEGHGDATAEASVVIGGLRKRVAELEAERDEREKQEPVAWYIDGEDGREYNGTPKMSGGRIGTPLYAAPPVITQHEPVTTVDDRHNADGKSCHITDDLPAGMPLYAAPPVAAPVRLTDEQAEKVDEAIREALGDAYDCLRVWNAWSYGTMGPDDFSQVAEDPDRVADIRNAAAAALGFKVGS